MAASDDKRLDLHGCKHVEAYVKIEDFILNNDVLPKYIITGNSKRMQEIALMVLEKYDFKYMIKSNNLGEIIVV